MGTLALIVMAGSTTVAGAALGAGAALWYRRRHEPAEVARLREQLVELHGKYQDLRWDHTLLQIHHAMNDREIAAIRTHWRSIIVDRRRPER